MGLRRTSQSIWGVATSVAPIGGYLSRADTTPCQSGKGTGRRPRYGTWRKRPHMCTGPGAAARDRVAATQGSTAISPEGAGGNSSNGRQIACAYGPASGRGQAGKAAARAFVGTTRKPAQPASAGQSGPSHGQRAQDCGTGAGLGRSCSPGSYGDRRWWFSITTAAAGRDWAKGATGGHSGPQGPQMSANPWHPARLKSVRQNLSAAEAGTRHGTRSSAAGPATIGRALSHQN